MSNDQATRRVEGKTITLDAFSNALQREAHVLQRNPNLLWQQLYNRLQWEDSGNKGAISKLIDSEFNRRISSGAGPWLHNKSRNLESEAFTRLFIGHVPDRFGPRHRAAHGRACALSCGAWASLRSASRTRARTARRARAR